jgi:hypothetical protein
VQYLRVAVAIIRHTILNIAVGCLRVGNQAYKSSVCTPHVEVMDSRLRTQLRITKPAETLPL